MTFRRSHVPLTQRRSPLVRRILPGLLAISLCGISPISAAKAESITFWAEPQGDLLVYQDLLRALGAEFTRESGVEVKLEVINWSVAFNTWLTVSQGGAAPDCADMYWLHSFAGIGGDQFGPMPINEYRDQWPDLEKDFYAGSLQDVFWQGDFYGIPWRTDIRPMIYRSDLLAAVGFDHPPATWDEIVEMGKALTVRDGNGNVTRWGFVPGANNPGTTLLPYYWQAGGRMLSDDGTKATIDNQAMREALQFLQDLVWKHQVTSPEIFEKSADPFADFIGGTVAIDGSAGSSLGPNLDRDNPELDGKWAYAVSAAGSQNRDTFSGAGYWGLLRGTQHVAACVDWIKFLSRPANMQRISEATGVASPLRKVMTSPFWSDRPWKAKVAEALEYGHTSQHASSVWSALASPEPGAVLYDLVYSTVIGKADIDKAVTEAQARMQAELDRAAR